jgi:ligand-binding sensor domain-containing protein/signal transduction histidine kinase
LPLEMCAGQKDAETYRRTGGTRMKIRAVFFALLIPALASASPDGPAIALSEYQKQEWHVEDGLPQSNVRAIIQAKNRLLLVGTSEGIASFDGVRFTPFRFGSSWDNSHEPVNAILISKSGDFWIGTDDRGVVLERGKGSIAISEEAGFHQERVRAMFEDRSGTIWVATQNGIERIVEGKIESVGSLGLVSGDITEPFAEDANGRVFIVTSNGLFLSDHANVKPYPLQNHEAGNATAVFSGGKDTVWIGLQRGLLKLTEISNHGHREELLKEVHGPVTTLLGDSDGSIWVGTQGHGICHVSSTGVISHWTTGQGLSDDIIHTMFQDDENNLWIGTLSGGLVRWRKSTLVPFGQPEGLPNSFAANVLADQRGDLWLGTWGSGLLRIRKGKLQQESLPGALSRDPIRALAEDRKGQIWIGTWFDGLYRYDGSSFKHFLTGGESVVNAISALYSDRAGDLWVGTYNGLIRFPTGIPDQSNGKSFLPGMLITSIKEDRDGSILVGTFNGLYRIRESTVEQITQKDGLSNPFILSVSVDNSGGIWVGTKEGGIDFVRGRTAIHVPAESGIPSYPVFSVLDDGRDMLWISTTRGLVRVPTQQMHDLVNARRKTVDVLLLGRNDGMRSSECGGMSQPPATQTKEGALWFVTAKGFVHTSGSQRPAFPPVEPFVTGVTIENNATGAFDQVVLPPGAGELEVKFDAIRLANPSQLQFRYKLDGYDRDWTSTSARRALYQHLPPGDYRFLVSAHDAGQIWNEKFAEVGVVQKPFFYQAAWFYVLALFSLIALVVLLFRWRVARVKGRLKLVMEERNRIALEWHDTLMAGFAAISWQLEATRASIAGDSSQTTSSLDLARNMVRHCQTEARRIIWDMHDGPEPVGPLSQALTKALDGMTARLQTKTQLRVIGEERILWPLAVHHLTCICQEAVTNAARHAAPTNIQIVLEYQPTMMTLSVQDDGRGFQLADASLPGHFGLSVMEERAKKVGGTFEIRSTPNIGTEVFVRVPETAAGNA